MSKIDSIYSEVDLAWTAGIIDGEGSIMFMRHHANSNPCPQVSVTNTSTNIIKKLHKLFGGTVRTQKKYKEHHTQAYVWGLSYNAALDFMQLIQPYLVTSIKSKRAKLLITKYKTIVKRNGKYTDKEKAMFIKLIDKFYSLS